MTSYARALGGILLALVGAVVACSSGSDNGKSGSDVNANCGNGVLDPGEDCDGTTSSNCNTATLGSKPLGTLGCTACHFDTGACYSASSTGGTSGGQSGAGGGIAETGGNVGAGGGIAETGGTTGTGGTSSGGTTSTGGTSSGGTTSTGGTTGTGGTTNAIPDIDALRTTCLDTINQYRATVGAPALTLASASLETCSDTGAASDAKTNTPHGSFDSCQGMNAQDTCPGWNPNQYGGVAGALKACLQSMWNEGLPPEGRAACVQEYIDKTNTACFKAHGHYLNMSDPDLGIVACGFYLMPNGDVWMNQDFGS